MLFRLMKGILKGRNVRRKTPQTTKRVISDGSRETVQKTSATPNPPVQTRMGARIKANAQTPRLATTNQIRKVMGSFAPLYLKDIRISFQNQLRPQ